MTLISTSRRKFLALAGAASITPSIVGVRPARSAEGRLVVMGVGGAWGDAVKQLVGDPFEAQHDTTVAYDSRPNAQQVAAIQAMRGEPSVDSVELGGPALGQAVALGLLDEIRPEAVPNYGQVQEVFRTPHMVGWAGLPFVLSFNTDTVSKSEAQEKGWQILLDPRLKGRVAIPKFGWQGEMWMNAVNLTLGGSYDNFDPIIEFCRRVIHENSGHIMESADQGTKLFNTGEVVAAPFFTGRVYGLIDKGVPLDIAYPEGWVPYFTGFCIVKGTPNKELVEKFIQISLSPEAQHGMAEKGYLPTNREVAQQVSGNPRLFIDDDSMRNAAQLDYGVMYGYADRNLERYNREVL